jgi:predicted phosphodiesterase
MRLAILADIHGNLLALEAVLADLEARGGADALVVAGDLCLDGPHPRAVLERVRALGCPVIQGNTDRDLAAAPDPAAEPAHDAQGALLAWTRTELGEAGVAYLRDLPFSHRVDVPDAEAAVLVVHANPRNLDDHLRPLAPEETVAPYLADLPPDVAVVAFGHLHIPYTRRIGRITLADVSSVGLPKDGDRRAGYGLLTWTGGAWEVEQRRVEYPVDTVVAQLRDANPPGVAELVRTLLRARYPNMAKARGGPAPRARQPRQSGAAGRRAETTPASRPAIASMTATSVRAPAGS